jgi:hypothetical protein
VIYILLSCWDGNSGTVLYTSYHEKRSVVDDDGILKIFISEQNEDSYPNSLEKESVNANVEFNETFLDCGSIVHHDA